MRHARRHPARGPPDTPAACDAQERLARTAWNTGGSSSWYLDRNGRNGTTWPRFTFRSWAKLRRFDPAARRSRRRARVARG
jgi:hypothetical protein